MVLHQVIKFFNGGSIICSTVPTGSNTSTTNIQLNFTVSSGLNAGQGSACRGNNSVSTDYLALSAEL
jgi:hypothetical protein